MKSRWAASRSSLGDSCSTPSPPHSTRPPRPCPASARGHSVGRGARGPSHAPGPARGAGGGVTVTGAPPPPTAAAGRPQPIGAARQPSAGGQVLLGELGGQPVEALVQTLALGRARRLNVPLPAANAARQTPAATQSCTELHRAAHTTQWGLRQE